MPTDRQFLDECWVGLVLSSPAAGKYGTSVTWMNSAFWLPTSLPNWRIALKERQAFDVADRAADLTQQKVGIATIRADEVLISSVTCGMTCTVAPR